MRYLKSGCAYHALAAAAVERVEATLLDRKRVLLYSAHLEGEYGIDLAGLLQTMSGGRATMPWRRASRRIHEVS